MSLTGVVGGAVSGVLGGVVGGVASAGFAAIFTAAGQWVATGAAWLLGQVGRAMSATTTVDLSSGWFSAHESVMATMAAAVVLPMVCCAALQLTARYGARAGTVVNNHRAKLFLSGIADPATLDHASTLIGDAEHPVASTTVERSSARSTTMTATYRRLAPADSLRRMVPGTGVLISGHLPPARITLRPWFGEAELRRRAQTGD